MRIRGARAEDAAAAAALWTDAYSGVWPGEGRVEPYSEFDFRELSAGAMVLVAETGRGEVVGISALRPPNSSARSVAGPGEAELSRLAVFPSARGAGIGRALVERTLALVPEVGAEGVALWSRPYQVEAHRLYESLGFRRAPGRDSADDDGRRLVFAIGSPP